MSVLAYVGIGSNLGDRFGNVRRAIGALNAVGRVRAASRPHSTMPWGRVAQPSFVNAVAKVETKLAPRDLLAALQLLERRLGRRPTYRWGPRVIDLDILTYDGLRIDEPELQLPHPRLAERPFMLDPLAELVPREGASGAGGRTRGVHAFPRPSRHR